MHFEPGTVPKWNEKNSLGIALGPVKFNWEGRRSLKKADHRTGLERILWSL